MAKVTCKWRLVFSTCLLIWCFSSLFITHKLLKQDVRKSEEASESDTPEVDVDNSETGAENVEKVVRKRQVVQGWHDFHGELLPISEIKQVSDSYHLILSHGNWEWDCPYQGTIFIKNK